MTPQKSTKRTILEDLEAFEGANPSLVHVSTQGLWLDIPIHHFRRREQPVINVFRKGEQSEPKHFSQAHGTAKIGYL
jgi:hypothetical protein